MTVLRERRNDTLNAPEAASPRFLTSQNIVIFVPPGTASVGENPSYEGPLLSKSGPGFPLTTLIFTSAMHKKEIMKNRTKNLV